MNVKASMLKMKQDRRNLEGDGDKTDKLLGDGVDEEEDYILTEERKIQLNNLEKIIKSK